jgi:hypothetical protein
MAHAKLELLLENISLGRTRMPKPKIAMIGAGSVVFTLNLLGDIFSFPELAEYLCRTHLG